MTDVAPIPPITGTVSLAVRVERAFEVFTRSINSWWPHRFHIGQAEVDEVVLEPWVDGRWYERGVDGSECDWGRVLAWEPPHRLLFTWQINGSWQLDPDPDHASEIEVLFRPDGGVFDGGSSCCGCSCSACAFAVASGRAVVEGEPVVAEPASALGPGAAALPAGGAPSQASVLAREAASLRAAFKVASEQV